MALPIYQIDAFTECVFGGNPAAVCFLDEPKDAAWMQSVATEMNLSETAFVCPRDGGGEMDLRWFTPAVEVDLCGHATLASAYALWHTGRRVRSEPVRFHTRSGVLTARQLEGGWIELDFPSQQAVEVPAPAGLTDALPGAEPAFVGANGSDLLVELEDEEALRRLEPDFRRLGRIDARGVMVTCVSRGPEYDFVSRFFAPACGIDEDPVTGSAHCCLGPFWATRLGKDEMVGFQASARGGVVRVRLDGDRVALGGRAVMVLRGELL